MSEGARRRPAGLGRGLNALLGDVDAPDAAAGGAQEIEIGRIDRNPAQPRRHFDEDALTELADSIVTHGLLQPIVVRLREADGRYEIVAGERRWRAAQRARLHRIPAVIRHANNRETLELAMIENIQREQLNPLEEAEAYRTMIYDYGRGQDELGAIVHKSRSHIVNHLRLLELPESIRTMVAERRLSMSHARALIGVPDNEAIAEEVIAKGWSVREVERRAKAAKGRTPSAPSARPAADSDIAMLERQLGDLLGLKVTIGHDAKGGAVTLHYATLDQLDMICQRLSGERI